MDGEVGWRWRAGACAVALLLASCGGDDDGDRDDRDQEPTSPLAEILGWGMATDHTGGPPEVTEVERQRQRRVEELIAECMADHGFAYVPVSPAERASGPFDEAYALEPAEFAARYGYGITTLSVPDDREATDPNRQIQDGLPEEQRRAYQRALWGDAVAGDPDRADPGSDAPDGGKGCQTWANNEVYGLDDAEGMAEGHARFQALFDELDLLWERIEDDPRLADADADWGACMADAGYPGFDRPHAAQQSVFDQLAALTGGAAEPDAGAVAELRDYELALAPVDHACREQHVEGPRRVVAHELETQFVAEHRAELEAYRDWMASVRPDGA